MSTAGWATAHLLEAWLDVVKTQGVWLGLLTAAPTDLLPDGSEVTSALYIRQPLTWVSGGSRIITNSSLMYFTGLRSVRLAGYGVYDAQTNGNCLLWLPLAVPVIVPAASNAPDQYVVGAQRLFVWLPYGDQQIPPDPDESVRNT